VLEHSIQLLKILSRGQSKFIRLALLSLPLILIIVFYSFFITQNLVDAFEKHMHKSYFGVFGDLQLVSTPGLLEEVYNAPELKHLNRSYRISTQSVLLFEADKKDVLKGVKLLAYETDYLINKFNSESDLRGYQSASIILSAVVFNQLDAGNYQIKSIFNPLTKSSANFNQQMKLDFGFLGSEPIVVMSLVDLQKLFSNNKREDNADGKLSYNQIEFNGLNEQDIALVKHVASSALTLGLANDYQLINQKALTQESRLIFARINYFKAAFFFILISISFAIYLMALKLLLNTKREALTILQCLGVSNTRIVMTLVLLIFVVTCLCLFLAQQLALLSTAEFIKFVGITL
jgi:hypothetical protein